MYVCTYLSIDLSLDLSTYLSIWSAIHLILAYLILSFTLPLPYLYLIFQ